MLDEAIVNEITADATLQPLLDDGNGGIHLYRNEVPANIAFTKAITFTFLGTDFVYPALERQVVQFNCIATTVSGAGIMARAISDLFNDRNAEMLGGVFGITYAINAGRGLEIHDKNAKLWIVPIDIRFKY